MYRKNIFVTVTVTITLFLSACGGGGGSGSSSGSSGSSGNSTVWTTSKRNLCALPITDKAGYYSLESRTVRIGTGMGMAGYSTFDTNGDGNPEILVGAGVDFGLNERFIILEYNSNTKTYETLCQSKVYTSAIRRLTSFKNKSITHGTILALSNGDIEIIDHQTGRVVKTISTGITSINDLIIADADNDGQDEIVILSDTELGFYNSDTYVNEGSFSVGGQGMAVGHFTRTDALQTAINSGLVLDIKDDTGTVVWDYTSIGFGYGKLSAGDLDSDGLDEIIGAKNNTINALNADTKGYLWQYTPPLSTINTVTVVDTDGDGKPEVIYSEYSGYKTYILDGVTTATLATYNNPGRNSPTSGVPRHLVADLDGDNQIELFWGSGSSTTGGDYLRAVDLATQQVDWTSRADDGPTYAVAFGDITGDGIPESLYATSYSESSYQSGTVTAINNSTGKALWTTSASLFGLYIVNPMSLAVADISADGTKEVILGMSNSPEKLFALSPTTGNIVNTLSMSGDPMYSLHVADVDKDGKNEIVIGSHRASSSSTGIYAFLVDTSTYTQKYKSPALGTNFGPIYSVGTIDWDQDNYLDIIALVNGDGVYILDYELNALLKTSQAFSAMAINGSQVYLSSAGTLYEMFSDATTRKIGTICSNNILSLEAIDSDNLAFTCNGQLGVYKISTATVTWQTGYLDSLLGINDSMKHAMVNGTSTLIVGGSVAYIFKLQ